MSITTYQITSPRFIGHVTIGFAGAVCVSYNAQDAELTETQSQYFLQKLAAPQDLFLEMLNQKKIFTITGFVEELTFDMFWNRYNEKLRSSKKKAQTKWERLSKQQQILAFSYIPKYFKSLPDGIAKKYAETYLHSEIWNN